ncbi:CAF17-like 4Fe-4S cluster assembly/insertion protein YgfZ [Asticcacaulis solisilvae]|uniref:CAF17-like 4Fe-4S cluster assembly/insertion protein YgfZ n=1 Tax=Asticcacaulis solisilvae TaxID=1217274 RepID=UPI003FD6F488
MTEIARLPHRALIRITGPDWAAFLKGLCTAHIDRITAEVADGRMGTLHYGAFLRPQGKMYADCLLMAKGSEDIWLDVPLSARPELLAKLNMYKLRAHVTIEALEQPVFVAFGGDLPEGFADDPRGVIAGDTFGFAYDTRTATADEGAWTAFRVGLGIASAGEDFDADALYAIDANLDLLDAIDFHKGCYVGQELTSRMKRRGQIKNRLLPLTSAGDLEKGAEILVAERKIGEVAAAYGRIGLGLMRLDRMTNADPHSSDHPVVVAVPAWIAPHIQSAEDAS